MKKSFLIVSLVALFGGCIEDEPAVFIPDQSSEWSEFYRPIYGTDVSTEVDLMAPQEITQAGKIYVYGDLLLVNDVGLGVHIFDNSDVFNPVKKYFISIPGNQDVAMKSGILYADSYNDFLAVKINADSAFILKRIENVVDVSNEFPPINGVFFECVDPNKGNVIKWERVNGTNGEFYCYRP